MLLDMAAELGYRLSLSGAETFRVEESVNRILAAYHMEAETFAIPNCLTVSIETPDGKPMTRMRRVGIHGNNMDAVEKFSNLSRRICKDVPDPAIAMQWLKETVASCRSYKLPMFLLGNFLGAFGFAILFGGNLTESVFSGICGLLVGLVDRFSSRFNANLMFKNIAASFVMSFAAYGFHRIGLANNVDAVIIGALMILVPGLIFTNAMRDIIYGDTNSGINRIVQVFLLAASLALGTGAAWRITSALWGTPASTAATNPVWLESIAAFIGCTGFFILFNVHGYGGFLCSLGGVITWVAYRMILQIAGNDITAYFFATLVATFFAEAMARIRKYPALSYLLISIFPLIPGAGVYYTMNHAFSGQMDLFASRGMHTIAIAGVMAAGILLASTTVRVWNTWILQRKKKK